MRLFYYLIFFTIYLVKINKFKRKGANFQPFYSPPAPECRVMIGASFNVSFTLAYRVSFTSVAGHVRKLQ